jgi:hypothetical protein
MSKFPCSRVVNQKKVNEFALPVGAHPYGNTETIAAASEAETGLVLWRPVRISTPCDRLFDRIRTSFTPK